MEGSPEADKCPVSHSSGSGCPVTGSAAPNSAGECPVQHNTASWLSLGSWFQSSQPSGPAAQQKQQQTPPEQPVVNPLTNEFEYTQQRQPGQKHALGVHRQQSSIPKVRTDGGEHARRCDLVHIRCFVCVFVCLLA